MSVQYFIYSYFQPCDYYGCIINIIDYASWTITLLLLQNPGNCSITKGHLCIEYKKKNYLAKSRHITELYAKNGNEFIVRCVRPNPCMVFNYHLINKKCILMPRLKCMARSYFNNTWYLLTLNVRGPSYLGLTRSILWLLMPWLLTSPGHQQPWYWLCRIGMFLSYLRKDFNYLRCINVAKWHKM